MTAISPSRSHHTAGLPLELFLVILESAARAWIDVHPRWTASLQLISRAAQSAIEPIIYHTFTVKQDHIIVWTGDIGSDDWHSVQCKDALRLKQMLASNAPIIQHLILAGEALDVVRAADVPTRSVPRLSVFIHGGAVTLSECLANPLKVTSTNTEFIQCGYLQGGLQSCLQYGTWTRARFCGTEVGWGRYDYYFIDASDASQNRSTLTASEERWLHLELGERMELETHVLWDIADVLRLQHNTHIVIACPVGYTTWWGLGVDKMIQMLDASRALPVETPTPDDSQWCADRRLEKQWCAEQHPSFAIDFREFRYLRNLRVDPDVLYSRVHVSHALWGCNGPGWAGSWYGRAVERGDAWDEGRLVQRFVHR